jgi:pimeloyl-ACP methyl ester carboxylesterase
VRALVDALGLDAPAVVGHSMGGFVALVYAGRHADACSGLVTVGGEVPEPLSFGERVESYRLAVVDALAPVVGRERVKRLFRRIDAWRFDERGKGDMDAIERVHERHGAEVPDMNGTESRKLDDALAAYHDESVECASIEVPSLHLCGEYEIPQVRRHARYMATRVPDGEVPGVPDAGHVAFVDNPAFVVEALRRFLRRSVAGGRG